MADAFISEELLVMLSAMGVSPQILRAAAHDPAKLAELLQLTEPSNPLSMNSHEELDIEDELRRVTAAAEQERALPPARAMTHFRPLCLLNWQEKIKKSQNIDTSVHKIAKAYVGSEKHFSRKSLGQLRQIHLREMFVRKVHKGAFLLCRVISTPVRLVGIELLIEDPVGDVRLLVLYNLPFMGYADGEDMAAILPIGTVLAIREPYLKRPLQGSEIESFVRVDSPSDVVFLRDIHPILSHVSWRYPLNVEGHQQLPDTALGWKESGNKYFRASRWLAAAVAYTNGLHIDPTAPVLWANRAQAYLNLDYFSAALSDAQQTILLSPLLPYLRRKGYVRAGTAEYERGHFEEALAHFMHASELSTPGSNIDVDSWIRRTKTRMREGSGEYNWLQLFLESQKGKRMDVAEFVGPVEVSLLAVEDGGRGVVATRDINVGELLVVAKPFTCAFKEDLPVSEVNVTVNLITKEYTRPCSMAALRRTIDRVCADTESYQLVSQLCPCPPYASPRSPYPPVSSNIIPCPSPLQPAVDIDVGLIESIFSNNAFGVHPLGFADFKSNGEHEDELPTALYLFPSLFNHSCASNTFLSFFREVMVIRAIANIPKGSQITVSYHHAVTAFEQQKILRKWNFTCKCVLCEEDRADGEVACRERATLLNNGNTSSMYRQNARQGGAAARLLLDKLSKTYSPNRSALRPGMLHAHHMVAHHIEKEAIKRPSRYRDAILEEMKALEAAGICVVDKSTQGRIKERGTNLPISEQTIVGNMNSTLCVSIMLMIVASFLSLQENRRAERWIRAAWWLENVTVGGGRPLFEERYKDILEGTGIFKFSKKISD